MRAEIIMPQVVKSNDSGTITKWLKKTGDAVQKDEPLLKVSADGLDAEIRSPVAGTVTQIMAPEGATAAVSSLIAIIDLTGALRSTVASSAAAVPSVPAPHGQSGAVVPLTKMRSVIARRMLESKRTSPHVHSVYKVDMTDIVSLRESKKIAFAQNKGFKLTYMPFIASAAVSALSKFPVLNASLIDDAVHFHGSVDLGIAVALDKGLIVPVVRQAQECSFLSLARSINDLVVRARSKKLLPSEVRGSTFTLTNSGSFGGEFVTAIINQPESAILAIGGLHKEPAVLTDSEGNDRIGIRFMQQFCLGFDHRLIDGADAGKFMSAFTKALERWDKEI